MPVALHIEAVGFKEAEKLLSGIPKAFPMAAAEAINRGLVAGRKVASQEIRQRYNIKAAALKGEGMALKKASWGKMAGTLQSKGHMLPISLFSPSVRVRRVVRRGLRRQFVTVAVIKGHRRLIKGGFMPGIGGKVFERRQPDRLPIWPVSTIGVPFMIGYKHISKDVQDTMARATAQRLEHLVNLYLSRHRSPA
jgi:Prophage minor tail protein Z (GPZ)